MDVIVSGKHLEVPDRLRTVTERKLAKIDRFTHDVVRVEVEYSEQRNPRIADPEVCTVTVQLKRRVVKAHAAGPRHEVALDLVIGKLEQQMTRIKGRRIGRSQPRRSRARGNGAVTAPGEVGDFDEADEEEGTEDAD
jgi:ribosomal subunit interface protein